MIEVVDAVVMNNGRVNFTLTWGRSRLHLWWCLVSSELAFSGSDRTGEPPTVQRIREAALKLSAVRGAQATSIRMVAAAAGVSIGLVQHHFGTKAGLFQAVDEYVIRVLGEVLAPRCRRRRPTPSSTWPTGDLADR
ncbi:TetR/AcrR family transcriptional regulator [Mycobacterium sp.]|uniref:TetR/AcrR family transcriptional regulator n=1 Tax=Mycobacterium sp. TaxID=1785 RepID=UPI003C74517B